MTAQLPPHLLKHFQPRPPLPYARPLGRDPAEPLGILGSRTQQELAFQGVFDCLNDLRSQALFQTAPNGANPDDQDPAPLASATNGLADEKAAIKAEDDATKAKEEDEMKVDEQPSETKVKAQPTEEGELGEVGRRGEVGARRHVPARGLGWACGAHVIPVLQRLVCDPPRVVRIACRRVLFADAVDCVVLCILYRNCPSRAHLDDRLHPAIC